MSTKFNHADLFETVVNLMRGPQPAHMLASWVQSHISAAEDRGRADERAKVVAWLRTGGIECSDNYADAIERGEHEPK